jgi:hypothetical protein
MKLTFREIRPDEVEKEVTQRDQFNSDEVELIEALVREAHQNSLDAKAASNSATPVKTRMAFHVPGEEHRDFLLKVFSGLEEHLSACGIETAGMDFGSPRFLVIEDFNTTGLRGSWEKKDDQPFSDFWRRVGKSHKGGQQGGRWGLGKLVFSGASQARTFFGLTVSADDQSQTPLLMGQAVLATHSDVTGKVLDAHGFFCEPRSDGFQLPLTDKDLIDRFRAAVGISRTGEPGLSIAIPFARTDVTEEALLRQLVRNYFFPVLVGQLESSIGVADVTAGSFASLAVAHGGPDLRDGRLMDFIGKLRTQIEANAPQLAFTADWTRGMEKALSPEQLTDLREKYARGELVHVRVPVSMRHRKKGQMHSHFDLFLRATDGDGYGLVVRGAITLPLEAREFRARRALGALIANDPAIVEFLGDAENPAHTKWNGNAEKLNANWTAAAQRLREIRSSLNAFADLLVQAVEKVELDAFIEVLSIPGGEKGSSKRRKRPVVIPPLIPPPDPKARKFRIQERRGGFVIRGATGLTEQDLPIEIQVSAAYDIMRGNPLKKHSPLDFDFQKEGITINSSGALASPTSANSLRIVVREPTFAVEATGFDINRDLVVRAVR